MELTIESIVSIVYGVVLIFSIFIAPYLAKIPNKLKSIFKGGKTNVGVDKDCDKVDRKVEKLAPVTKNTTKLLQLIIEAEHNSDYTGFEKLTYVLTNYHQYCIDNKFTFNEALVTKSIDDLIDLTKSVNQRDKDIKVDNVESESIEVQDIHRL